MFETVLLPIDHSQNDIEVAHKTIEFAKSQKSHLIMLEVIKTNETTSGECEQNICLLIQAKKKIEAAGISYDFVQKKGTAALIICGIAEERNVDVIVMGTKGLNLLNDTNNTASKVIQLSQCPVLVIP